MRLRVLTPSAVVAEVDVESVTMPGVAGEFTAMPGHDSLLALLAPGRLHCALSVQSDDVKGEEFGIGPGLVEVIHDLVTVCVGHAERMDGTEGPKGGKVEG